MNFKKWLKEDSISELSPTSSQDPELNGLARIGLAEINPLKKRPKSRASRKIDQLFGRISIESTQTGGAGFVYTDGQSILLLKRSKQCEYGGLWDLPGGGSQEEETPKQTAERESKEEIGRVAGTTFHKSREGSWTFFFNKVKTTFKCKLNDEHTQFKWVSLDAIDNLKMHPKVKQKINNYVSIIKSNFGF